MKDLLTKTRPKTTKEIVGNTKLIAGLKNDLKNSTGGGYLIVGPIGIGKTLSVELIIQELKFDLVWLDAADCNSKSISNLDTEGQSIKYFMSKYSTSPSDSEGKRVIVIDNANSFRDGASTALIKKLKTTQTPIVIICNDAYPLRTIEKYCKVYKFNRPTKLQIRKFLIQHKILKVPDDPAKKAKTQKKIEELISNCRNDIRYILNMLGVRMTKANKDTITNDSCTVFDASKSVFDRRISLKERLGHFFYDPYIVPMMVHENLIGKKKGDYSRALDYLSLSDYYAAAARPGIGNMGITMYQGLMVIQATNCSPHFPGFCQYTKLLGKESTIRSKTEEFRSLSVPNFRTQYLPAVLPMLVKLISEKDFDRARDLMKSYNLEKDQIYDLLCKCWLGVASEVKVPTASKSAFTRFLKKPRKKEW